MAELSDTAPRVSDKGKAVDSPPDNSGQDALRDEAGLVKPETNLRDSTEVGNSAVLPTIEIDMGAEEVGSEVKIDAGPDTRAETRAESAAATSTCFVKTKSSRVGVESESETESTPVRCEPTCANSRSWTKSCRCVGPRSRASRTTLALPLRL